MKEPITFPEKKAQQFMNGNLSPALHNGDSDVKYSIQEAIGLFSRPQDVQEFLMYLLQLLQEEDQIRILENYGHGPEDIERIRFFINQELEKNSLNFKNSWNQNEQFTGPEQAEMNDRINEILEKLKKTNAGQEILFNEINELKDFLFLKKKNFRQLVIGKLGEMVLNGIIDKTISEEIVNVLGKGTKLAIELLNS